MRREGDVMPVIDWESAIANLETECDLLASIVTELETECDLYRERLEKIAHDGDSLDCVIEARDVLFQVDDMYDAR